VDIVPTVGKRVWLARCRHRPLPSGAVRRSTWRWVADLQSDARYRIPALRSAEALGGQTHVCEFAWRLPQFNGRLGACHATERGFVFDTLAHQVPMVGESPPHHLAKQMHRAWGRVCSQRRSGMAPPHKALIAVYEC
jgi:carboxylesterase type B